MTNLEDAATKELLEAMIDDLEKAGAKKKLPERKPGQFTSSELARLGDFSGDSHEWRRILSEKVKNGEWRRLEVVIHEPDGRTYHSWVYEKVK